MHLADSNAFLTALAAQERHVLELREELHKANEDLEKLKNQWAVHEAMKKKNELQTLTKPLLRSSTPSCDHDSARTRREVDRQNIISSSSKPSHRKVFAGSRHTRALSLLSSKYPGSHSNLLLRGNGPSQLHQHAANDVVVPTTGPKSSSLDVESGPQKGVIVETGKQLVGDFRQGLWTFFEDFKQLTVGDEGVGSAGLRNPPTLTLGDIPKWQNMKAKRSATQASPARKAGASDVVRESSKKAKIEVSDSEQRVGSSLGRSTGALGPTSTSIDLSPERGDVANTSDSDDNGWDI